MQYTVQTDYPTPIIVNQQWQSVDTSSTSNEQKTDNATTQRFRQGDKVYLHWIPENAIVLPAD